MSVPWSVTTNNQTLQSDPRHFETFAPSDEKTRPDYKQKDNDWDIYKDNDNDNDKDNDNDNDNEKYT